MITGRGPENVTDHDISAGPSCWASGRCCLWCTGVHVVTVVLFGVVVLGSVLVEREALD